MNLVYPRQRDEDIVTLYKIMTVVQEDINHNLLIKVSLEYRTLKIEIFENNLDRRKKIRVSVSVSKSGSRREDI